MADEAKPKFSIWLGDNWPGPYIVTYEREGRRGARSVVVNGVTNISDALAVANAQFPDEDARSSVSISPAHVAEASHFLALLESRRVEREEAAKRHADKQQQEQRDE